MSAPAFATFRALGTGVTVATADPAGLAEAIDVVERHLEAVDAACSRFRDDSQLAAVATAGGREVAVGPVFLEALEAALRAARLTDGLVTPAVGRSLRLAGYDRDLGAIRPLAAPAGGAPAPDWRTIAVDRERGTVRVPAGLELDLGATAKALAADRAATTAARDTGCGVLVALGGDIRVAGEPLPGGWPVAVDDAHDRITAAAQHVLVESGGVATSGTTARRWRRNGREQHHILDPATGAPASGPWRTATVAAATCLDANVASTAAILLGAGAPAWLERHGLPARLVAHDGRVVVVAGWPEPRRAAA